MRKLIKKHLKSEFFQRIIAWIVYLYILTIYYTSRWQYVLPEGYDIDYYKNLRKTIMISWHDNIAILPLISHFQFNRQLHALASPHGDGRIIADAMSLMGYKIIKGSSNKNALMAFKEIVKLLKAGGNMVITPDGPRGPRHHINGNVVDIAKISGATIVPIISKATNYFRLDSWDKLILPLPFGRITVYLDEPIAYDKTTVDELAFKLNELGSV